MAVAATRSLQLADPIDTSSDRIPLSPPGQAFQEIAREPAVAETLFEILEAQRILAGKARIALLPGGPHSSMLANLLAAENGAQEAAGPAK